MATYDPSKLTGAALTAYNKFGGIPANKFEQFKAAGLFGEQDVTAPAVVSGSDPIGTANTINATNLDFVRGGQQTDPTYGAITNLLDPNWGVQAYDSAQASAEDAAARGISGSNLANFRGARQYASDIRGNALAASQLLTGATGRLPTPYSPDRLITSPLDQEKLNLDRDQLAQQANLAREAQIAETNRALIAANSRGRGGGGGQAGSPGGQPSWPPPSTSGSGSYGGTLGFGGGETPVFPGNDFSGGNDFGPTSPDYSWGGNDPWNTDMFGALGTPGASNSGSDDWWNQPLDVSNYEDYLQ